MVAVSESDGDPHRAESRRLAAYRRANLLLSGAGVTLALAGVSPRSPVMEAIRRALRAVNLAGGIEAERKEASRGHAAGGSRFAKTAG